MPRRPRLFLPGHPVHVIQRGNNRGQVFFAAEDAKKYIGWLEEAAAKHGLAIHAYVLMTNHVHLLVSPESFHALPRAMRDVNWRFSRHINDTQARTGSVWEGRYRASIVEADDYFFACSRYIELNPVRAGLAKTPGEYRWSSYRANAEGRSDALISPHELYTRLGENTDDQAMAYRSLFDGAFPEPILTAIRESVNGGWPLGKDSFATFVTRQAGADPLRRKRGRPARAA